jgi:phosphoribosylformylglycinamidine cyclo-ligase
MADTNVRDLYQELGVSSSKEGVHKATKDLEKGLFPGAFCKIIDVPKMFDQSYAKVMHADGAGTKSNLAYLMKMEGYDDYLRYFSSLAQDVMVMNTDDMFAVGPVSEISFSNHISRNAIRISDDDIAAVINGYTKFVSLLKEYGIDIKECGGETADVGSYTTTIGLDATFDGYIKKKEVIDCSNIRPDNIIIGLPSYGQSIYETVYNSGIRSNGLTLGINCMLSPYYRKYIETWDSALDVNKVFRGPYMMDSKLDGTGLTVGEALLSPTRTYTPVLNRLFSDPYTIINGIIHCSGGGMTKSMNFGQGIVYVKNQLIDVPPLFNAIQATEDIDDVNMYKTFNMGTGMEIIVPEMDIALHVLRIIKSFGIDAQIVGYVSKSKDPETNQVVITTKNGKVLEYKKNI